jgi:hypothetical protein
LRTPLNLDLLSQLDLMDFMDFLNLCLIQRWMCQSMLGNLPENPVQMPHLKRHHLHLIYLNIQMPFYNQSNQLNYLNSNRMIKLLNLTHSQPLFTNQRQRKTSELIGVASNSKRPCRLDLIDVHRQLAQFHMILHNPSKMTLNLDFQI